MTQPLPDHRRRPGPPYLGEVPAGADWRRAARLLRTTVALVLGTAAATALAAAVVLALGAVQVISPERPARVVPVLLSAPDLRQDLAEDWAEDLQTDSGVGLTTEQRGELVGVLDDALASPELHRRLADLRPVGDRLDVRPLGLTVSEDLAARAEGRPPPVREVLRTAAEGIRADVESAPGPDAASGDTGELVRGLTNLRRVVLVAALVVAVPGLVLVAVAAAVARRRALTAVLVASGTLLLAALVLAPGRLVLDRLPGPLVLPGHLLAAIGQLAGAPTMWTLVLGAALPPALWWALRSLRPSPATDAAPPP